MPDIAVVILAAGAGSRYRNSGGQGPKQLANINGKPMLQHGIDRIYELAPGSTYTVLGHAWQTIADKISNTTVLVNTNWQQGLGSSIALATSEITGRMPDCQGLMFVLADQPALGCEELAAMLSLFDGSQAVCASYEGSVGVPAIFPPQMFAALMALSADSGAKVLLQSIQDSLLTLAMPGAAMDIDTIEDLQRLKALNLAD